MYKNNSVKSQFQLRVDDTYHYNVRVKVGVHEGLALGLLLFVIMLEAMSHKFRRGCPWELSYTDDLDISLHLKRIAEKKVESVERWYGGQSL